MYYVGFSTATIVASLILFQGFNTRDATNTVSLLAGFIVTFLGVHILNISRLPEPPLDRAHSALEGGLMNPRLSLQGRLSIDGWHGIVDSRVDSPRTPRTAGHGRRSSLYRQQTSTLFNSFEGEEDVGDNVGLHQLREEDESDDESVDADERTHLQQNISKPNLSRSNSRSPNLHASR